MKDTKVMNLDLSKEIAETKRILTEGFQRGLREIVRTQQIVERSFTDDTFLAEEVVDAFRQMEPGSALSEVLSAEVIRRSEGFVGAELIPVFTEIMHVMQDVVPSDTLDQVVVHTVKVKKQGGTIQEKGINDLTAKDYVEYLFREAADTSVFGASHSVLITEAREKIEQKIAELLSEFPHNQTIAKSARNFRTKYTIVE